MDDSDLTDEIRRQVEEWSTNSNECLTIQIVRGDGSVVSSFTPEFTYPIFGDEEAIFGYQGLEITLSFTSHNMLPRLSIKYDKQFPPEGEVKATDIEELFRDFLPDAAFKKADDGGLPLRDDEASTWQPPGRCVHKYTGTDEDGKKAAFETFMVELNDPEARRILENMQVLVPMLIEGGTALQLEQDWSTKRWKLFLTYQKQDEQKLPTGRHISPYTLTGFGTSYRVFAFPGRETPNEFDLDQFKPSKNHNLLNILPDPNTGAEPTQPVGVAKINSPLELPSRERLSQFIILPPYQRRNHGNELYNAMYQQLTSDSNVREFTVEDPNESFDELRDLCDMLALRNSDSTQDFAALKINTDIPADRMKSTSDIPIDLIVPLKQREMLRHRTKIMPRQLDRLVEMQTLSKIPAMHRSRTRITRKEKSTNEHDKAYYFWRLYVKQRLYIFNRDQLAQVEREERIDKLESALDSVQEAYATMIEKVEAREARSAKEGKRLGSQHSEMFEGTASEAEGGAETATLKKRKRKVVDDDDDEEDGDAEGADGTNGDVVVNGHKKPKI